MNPTNALIQFKSSAGSGKTFQLVLEYLKIVIKNPYEYRQVLAITFTNKATDEMKSRIIETLSELATLKGEALEKNEYHSQLKEALKGRRIDISKQAEKVLNLILGDYSNFSVSTIESFFQRVIRAFAKELNIPLGYELEMKTDQTLDHIINATFKEVGGEQKELTRLLSGFMERKMEEEKGWKIENEIKSLGREVFKERFQDLLVSYGDEEEKEKHLKKVFELAKDVFAIRNNFESGIRELAEAGAAMIKDAGLGITDFKYGKSGAVNTFYKLLDDPAAEIGKRALNATEGGDEWYTKTSPHAGDIQNLLDDGLLHFLQDIVAFRESQYKDYITAKLVSQTLYSFGVMNDLQKKLVDYRLENNTIIISDTNYLLKQVVSKHYDAPFVYEKVGTRYLYYLIDEFQDTSDMQWNNLFPLVYNVISAGSDSLIVGDVKQSIYRWRNGRMLLLMREVEEQMKSYGQPVIEKHLTNNWRTAEGVVAFNNAFFVASSEEVANCFPEGNASEMILDAYADVRQTARVTGIEGFVGVEMFSLDKNETGRPVPSSWKPKALKRMTEIIREVVADGYDPGDIALLVRSNKDGIEVAEYLQQLDEPIQVVSSDSLKVFRHPWVRFLYAVMAYLNDDKDPILLAMVSYYHLLLTKGGDKVEHSLFSGAALPDSLEKLISKKKHLRKLPVYECLEQIRHLFPAMRTPNAYVEAFLDDVLAFSSSQDASISGYLEYWKDAGEQLSISAAEEKSAVKILTIHKAKGLEFPVVILPLAEWDLAPKPRSILWVEPKVPPYNEFPFLPVELKKDLADSHFEEDYAKENLMSHLDNLNMLYVAFTRPKYRLYVLSKERTNDAIKSSGDLINQFVDGNVLGGELKNDPFKALYLGTPAPKPPQKENSESQVKMMTPIPKPLSDWNAVVRIRYGSNRYLKSGIIERNEKILAGQLLHEALALIYTHNDVAEAVETMIHKGFLDENGKESFTQLIKETISHREAKDWYDPSWKVKNEAEILSADGRILRPDRVNIKGDYALVIDYKTGKVQDRHKKQILSYMEALRQIGYKNVGGAVYYTILRQVHQIL